MDDRYAMLPIEQIEPDPLQPRHELESADDPTLTEARTLQGLAHSIAEVGILQPIRVRRIVDAVGERYRIISGQRRYEAAKIVGLDIVPCLVDDSPGDAGAVLLVQITENLQRKALTANELAIAVHTLLNQNASRDEVARQLGIQSSQITLLLSLLKLSDPVKSAFARGRIESPRAAYDLNRLPPALQERLIVEADAKGRIVTQRDVREERLAHQQQAQSERHRYEAPALSQPEYTALLALLNDGVTEDYAPGADRAVVFGSDWITLERYPQEIQQRLPQGTAGPSVEVPRFRLTQAQAERLLSWLGERLPTAGDAVSTPAHELGRHIATLLSRF